MTYKTEIILVQKLYNIASKFSYTEIPISTAFPLLKENEQMIYNGFPPDIIDRLTITNEEKTNKLNEATRKAVYSILLELHTIGKLRGNPTIKAMKKTDERTGRELFLVYTIIKKTKP